MESNTKLELLAALALNDRVYASGIISQKRHELARAELTRRLTGRSR